MNKPVTYVLIHSPLVGPLTWQLVDAEMQRRGLTTAVPALRDGPDSARPFWQQHAESVVHSLAQLPAETPLVLVAHSGAGPLLPAIREQLSQAVAAYLFVDAGIPRPQLSRLDLMRLQDKEWVEPFYQGLLQGAQFPTWQAADLQNIIPDEQLRQQMVAEINPRSLPFFTEPLPVFKGWPDAPCVYIKFSAPYDWDFQQAKAAGWLVQELSAGHFHMLVEPAAVTDLIVEAVQRL